MNWETRKKVLENKDLLKKAFARMRRSKLIARMNFSCCGGCASYELGSRVQSSDGKKLGYVFYHRQANEDLENDGKCFISFGPWYERDADDNEPKQSRDLHDERTKIVGTIAVAALVAEGIKVDWNGDASKCIEIDLTVDATGLLQKAA